MTLGSSLCVWMFRGPPGTHLVVLLGLSLGIVWSEVKLRNKVYLDYIRNTRLSSAAGCTPGTSWWTGNSFGIPLHTAIQKQWAICSWKSYDWNISMHSISVTVIMAISWLYVFYSKAVLVNTIDMHSLNHCWHPPGYCISLYISGFQPVVQDWIGPH